VDGVPPVLRGEAAQQGADAGVVGVALLGHDVEGPEVVGPQEVGHPVAEDTQAARPLQGFARPLQVLAQLRRVHLPDRAVPVAAAGDLMSLAGDLPHHLGHGVGDPAQHEERGFHAIGVEKLQCLPRIAGDAGLEPVPVLPLDEPRERADLVVVLDSDGEQHAVRHGRTNHPDSESFLGGDFLRADLPSRLRSLWLSYLSCGFRMVQRVSHRRRCISSPRYRLKTL
jgi:hypothetical protein